ncbi:hypothetical protein DPMN_088748 [Dreissena polymorpha]|uniref:Uncharacterized protein n=1 Tax=Dreissena polymorpha TaxID=45954 RepID=A0A9D4KWF4_DREPO|nr:hypothetical protein DPMN_088748 [Dreissena polymorpha]
MLGSGGITIDSLFGGRIQAAIKADQEDQIFATLVSNNSGQRQGVFKCPASNPPEAPTAKNTKKNNFFSERPSSIPHLAPNRPSSYNRSSSYRNSSDKDAWKKG